MHQDLKRRHFLQWGAASVGALLVQRRAFAALPARCGETPAQTAGPFYPGENNISTSNDLTVVMGATAPPLGQVIYIEGQVRDLNCAPIAGANVEIWQACSTGRYNSSIDTNPAALDPNFKYWGECATAVDGTYSFKSILPGAYPADTDWDRPPHIHFRIAKRGFHELTTQMYFKGEVLNDADKILKNVPTHMRGEVIVDFISTAARPAARTGKFNITLLRV